MAERLSDLEIRMSEFGRRMRQRSERERERTERDAAAGGRQSTDRQPGEQSVSMGTASAPPLSQPERETEASSGASRNPRSVPEAPAPLFRRVLPSGTFSAMLREHLLGGNPSSPAPPTGTETTPPPPPPPPPPPRPSFQREGEGERPYRSIVLPGSRSELREIFNIVTGRAAARRDRDGEEQSRGQSEDRETDGAAGRESQTGNGTGSTSGESASARPMGFLLAALQTLEESFQNNERAQRERGGAEGSNERVRRHRQFLQTMLRRSLALEDFEVFVYEQNSSPGGGGGVSPLVTLRRKIKWIADTVGYPVDLVVGAEGEGFEFLKRTGADTVWVSLQVRGALRALVETGLLSREALKGGESRGSANGVPSLADELRTAERERVSDSEEGEEPGNAEQSAEDDGEEGGGGGRIAWENPMGESPNDRGQEGIEGVFVSPCGHFWHSGCVKNWFQLAHTCPTCRRDFPRDVSLDHALRIPSVALTNLGVGAEIVDCMQTNRVRLSLKDAFTVELFLCRSNAHKTEEKVRENILPGSLDQTIELDETVFTSRDETDSPESSDNNSETQNHNTETRRESEPEAAQAETADTNRVTQTSQNERPVRENLDQRRQPWPTVGGHRQGIPLPPVRSRWVPTALTRTNERRDAVPPRRDRPHTTVLPEVSPVPLQVYSLADSLPPTVSGQIRPPAYAQPRSNPPQGSASSSSSGNPTLTRQAALHSLNNPTRQNAPTSAGPSVDAKPNRQTPPDRARHRQTRPPPPSASAASGSASLTRQTARPFHQTARPPMRSVPSDTPTVTQPLTFKPLHSRTDQRTTTVRDAPTASAVPSASSARGPAPPRTSLFSSRPPPPPPDSPIAVDQATARQIVEAVTRELPQIHNISTATSIVTPVPAEGTDSAAENPNDPLLSATEGADDSEETSGDVHTATEASERAERTTSETFSPPPTFRPVPEFHSPLPVQFEQSNTAVVPPPHFQQPRLLTSPPNQHEGNTPPRTRQTETPFTRPEQFSFPPRYATPAHPHPRPHPVLMRTWSTLNLPPMAPHPHQSVCVRPPPPAGFPASLYPSLPLPPHRHQIPPYPPQVLLPHPPNLAQSVRPPPSGPPLHALQKGPPAPFIPPTQADTNNQAVIVTPRRVRPEEATPATGMAVGMGLHPHSQIHSHPQHQHHVVSHYLSHASLHMRAATPIDLTRSSAALLPRPAHPSRPLGGSP
uniref:RING-type domain-containing protein n=1 Tax=Chromera velia CCMP2878 TaxID=1169474 RepID=A0A0G4H8V4_9ALVE|eukprot:Cvel_5922.t1-p1 / transcript=Cvel_5922.t1 / gene=Cvel_5922 / organism=Chromera_velia_CCMP2878 / gene_product=hypothetical protein / transcript_product=hypothetical protein / location=Cvel_scaffold283:53232-58258(-) / protein_length=1206 / sequence_SO=supercontig / SO=protein_coding / is_pseudo=false